MNDVKLERAIALGKKVGHFFIALVSEGGFPYINSAHHIEQLDENRIAVEEWICPLSVKHLSDNPKMAVLIWDSAADDGYEILGEVLGFEGQTFMNGFRIEPEESTYLPQVRRKLIIRAEQITAFSHALRCDDIQRLTASDPARPLPAHGSSGDIWACRFAPEWAEHARFDRGDEPCDDGRAGSI
jgi:hypothetical protein